MNDKKDVSKKDEATPAVSSSGLPTTREGFLALRKPRKKPSIVDALQDLLILYAEDPTLQALLAATSDDESEYGSTKIDDILLAQFFYDKAKDNPIEYEEVVKVKVVGIVRRQIFVLKRFKGLTREERAVLKKLIEGESPSDTPEEPSAPEAAE